MKQLQQNGGVCHGQPSISETVAQQSSVFPANRRRAEVVHAPSEPNDSDGNPGNEGQKYTRREFKKAGGGIYG